MVPSGSRRRAALALSIVVPAPSIGAAAAFVFAPGAAGQLIYGIGKVLLYGLPVVWHLAVDRAPLSVSPARRGGWGMGLALGFLLSAAVALAWLAFGRGSLDPTALRALAAENGFDTPLRYLALAAWLGLVNSALEEYVFRWFYVSRWQAILGEGAPARRPAVLLSALCFTSHHVVVLLAFFEPPVALAASGGVLAGGLAWSWLYARCGSIWPCWLSHVLVDATVLAIGWRLIA